MMEVGGETGEYGIWKPNDNGIVRKKWSIMITSAMENED